MVTLYQASIILIAAIAAVPLSNRLGLGSILGYLLAGVIIGPYALGFVDKGEDILHFAELGVILFLFIVGLELKPRRLWALRRSLFGMGAIQLVITGLLLALLVSADKPMTGTLILGFALALSSTAFALQMLSEKKQMASRHGRASISILLFQDLSVAPLLAIIPLLGGTSKDPSFDWTAAAYIVLFVLLVIAASQLLVRPLFRYIAMSGSPELLVAGALLIVLATGLAADAVGISMALGAFMAGVLLADSELRHQLEADIQPFKGLLLGLFFIAIGMMIDLRLLVSQPMEIVLTALSLIACKGAVLFLLGRGAGMGARNSLLMAATLCQGGEFAFVLLTAAVGENLVTVETYRSLIVVVSLSMAATPLLYLLADRLTAPGSAAAEVEDVPVEEYAPVIIAGFGRVGQIIARALNAKDIHFVALESRFDQLDFVRKYGNKVYYADARNIDTLRSAGLAQARVLVLALQDVEASLRITQLVRSNFPKVRIVARARNREHAHQLMATTQPAPSATSTAVYSNSSMPFTRTRRRSPIPCRQRNSNCANCSRTTTPTISHSPCRRTRWQIPRTRAPPAR
jgi:monovalent cation:proton antiporter-2 (CPA2) family protein